ncbi:MAG: BadF/BadG/BcrA/BcrD ATPase family protein [Azospirillaceae bacterium]
MTLQPTHRPDAARPHADGEMRWLIAVDGGATTTRVRIAAAGAVGEACARSAATWQGEAGPSSLFLDVERAWRNIGHALDRALAAAGLALGDVAGQPMVIGLASTRIANRLAAFRGLTPEGFRPTIVSDGYAALIGAFGGRPGVVVVAGTGSVAHALDADGRSVEHGGWDFPVGDEGGGAWLGWRALQEAIRQLDGTSDRYAETVLPARLIDTVAGSATATTARRGAILDWIARATATDYGRLAPLVIDAAKAHDALAEALLAEAGGHLGRLARATDPTGRLPIALTGGIAPFVRPYLDAALGARIVAPLGDALDGALLLAAGKAPPERLAERLAE